MEELLDHVRLGGGSREEPGEQGGPEKAGKKGAVMARGGASREAGTALSVVACRARSYSCHAPSGGLFQSPESPKAAVSVYDVLNNI